jgi:hypothetical protein
MIVAPDPAPCRDRTDKRPAFPRHGLFPPGPPSSGHPLVYRIPRGGETPLPRHDWAHGARGWRSCRGNISEPRAPVRHPTDEDLSVGTPVAALRFLSVERSRQGTGPARLTARGFSLSRPLLKTAAKEEQQGTIPARKRSPLKTLSRGFESFFVGWKILPYVVSAGPS